MKGIYRIINPFGKIYIGKSADIEGRFLQYRNISNRKQPKLNDSLRKYGYQYHRYDVIYLLNETESLLDLHNHEVSFYNYYVECGYEMLNTQSPKFKKV